MKTTATTDRKERPILFSGPMVNAILEGRKTQTRRIVSDRHYKYASVCPYGQIGDRLWVRETWADVSTESGPAILYKALGAENTSRYHFCSEDAYPVEYERYPTCKFTMWCGDLLRGEPGHAWRPSIFMPRNLSRITLEITDVRVERLQDITEEDARAEGFECGTTWQAIPGEEHRSEPAEEYSATDSMQQLWDKINGKRASWDSNPYVWVITFKRL